MTNQIQKQVFSDLMTSLNIEPANTNKQRFYEWMRDKVKHPYVDNPDAMKLAFAKIIED